MPSKKATKARQFVLLSDLHAHAWSAFSKGEGADNSRLRRSLQILDQSLARAQTLGVPWVFGGDIVHTAGYALNTVLGGLTEILLRYPDVEKLVVWGNHDARGIGGKITLDQTVLATLSKVVDRFHVIDPTQVGVFETHGLTFSGAGYQPRGDLLEYGQQSDVGIYHQTVGGTKGPNGFILEEGIPAEELTNRHRVAVVGHVHHWQYHPDKGREGGQLLLIPGSPEHHNFGDMGEHGWWLVTVPERGKAECEFVAGGSPEFRTVGSPKEVKNDGHFYRVSGGMEGEVLPQGAIAIAPTATSIVSRDLLHGARGEQSLSAWIKAEPPELLSLGEERFLAAGRSLLGPYETGNLRPLKLKQVKIRNFCSYSEQVFNVRPGTWLVVGRGRDFPSNGAGKSSLFEAVFWSLFGRTTKGLTGDEVIRWGEDDCEVTTVFIDQNDRDWLKVTRSRGKSSQVKVETSEGVMEAKSVNELTEKLGQWLGVTAELYQALGYFSQEKLLLFASATDGERKDMLADLIGLAAYQEASQSAYGKLMDLQAAGTKIATMKEAAIQRREAESNRLAAVSAKIVQWESDRAKREQQAHDALFAFERFETTTREQLLKEAREQLGRTLEARRQAAQKRFDELRFTSTEKTNTLKELAEAQAAHAQALANVQNTRTLIVENVRQQANVTSRRKAQVALLVEGKCPSCGQEVTAAHKEKCLLPFQEELDALQLREYDLTAKQKPELTVALNAKARLDEVTAGVAEARQQEQRALQFSEAEKVLTAIELESVEVEASAQSHASKVLAAHRKELVRIVNAVQSEQSPFGVEQEGTRQRIQEAEVDVMHHTEARIRVQEEIAVYDYWRRGFSKQGIQSLLVDEVAGLFNEARGTIFPALTQGVYDVQFSTLSQTKSGEWREKTDFQIYEHGKPVPYAALSGGQRRRVDVGVMLTLVKAVSKWMQVPGMLGMLVLDEVFGFLDGSGAEGLMEALREMQEQIPTIFVVSHEPQLQALFPEVIVVEQDKDGISSIVT